MNNEYVKATVTTRETTYVYTDNNNTNDMSLTDLLFNNNRLRWALHNENMTVTPRNSDTVTIASTNYTVDITETSGHLELIMRLPNALVLESYTTPDINRAVDFILSWESSIGHNTTH